MKRTMLETMGAVALLAATGLTPAQGDYPTRVIRMVVAWPPGSGVDVLMRQLAEPLRAELRQS